MTEAPSCGFLCYDLMRNQPVMARLDRAIPRMRGTVVESTVAAATPSVPQRMEMARSSRATTGGSHDVVAALA
jgi:hypothetical protein